jgi:hypothetical protein
MQARRLVVACAALFAVASVAAAGTTSLLATSRPSRSSARLTYSSSDALAGLTKGSGTGTSAISAQVFVATGGSTAVFSIPTGTYANGGYTYRYGWVANDAERALFLNRDAPSGPTGVARTLFATGRRVRLLTKSLGDTSPLDLAAAPADVLRVAYVVTNGTETTRHCAQFLAGACTYTPLDGGTGWRLRCRDGVADPSCGAAPSCGNGIRETFEECDGGPLCGADCKQGLSSCCELDNQCANAPAFTLFTYLIQYCQNIFGIGVTPIDGLVCGGDGVCVDMPVGPTPVCCQTTATTCTDSVRSSLRDLYIARHDCAAVTGLDVTKAHLNAVCGAGGVCVPQ